MTVDVTHHLSILQLTQSIRGLVAQATPEQLEELGIIDIEPELIEYAPGTAAEPGLVRSGHTTVGEEDNGK